MNEYPEWHTTKSRPDITISKYVHAAHCSLNDTNLMHSIIQTLLLVLKGCETNNNIHFFLRTI